MSEINFVKGGWKPIDVFHNLLETSKNRERVIQTINQNFRVSFHLGFLEVIFQKNFETIEHKVSFIWNFLFKALFVLNQPRSTTNALLTTFAALLVIVVYMIMKYVSEYSEYEDGRSTVEDVYNYTESSPILPPAKTMPVTYGTCDQWDVESSGHCSSSSITGSPSEELYDGKICVICYTEPRNCFLVPCGHCATCYECAQR